MTISESQLKTWANQGATVTAQQTHQQIRNVLTSRHSALTQNGYSEGRDYEIYLQGSYRNTTNIRGDSDVDIVVQFNKAFTTDLSSLNQVSRNLLVNKGFVLCPNPYIHWLTFYNHVYSTLLYNLQGQVKQGNKSLKLLKGTNRLAADVVPCIRHLKFNSWRERIEGITFYKRDNSVEQIINFPKLHFDNGTNKNQKYTNQRYKPTVRLFKNARLSLEGQGLITKGSVPSYFLECLLYNVPDGKFKPLFQETYQESVAWLYQNFQSGDARKFICQNKQLYLFGNGADQWNFYSAKNFVHQLINLWN